MAHTAIEPVSRRRRSILEPRVASVGAQIAAEMPNAAMSRPARSTGMPRSLAITSRRPPTLRKLVATKKFPAMRTMRRDVGIYSHANACECRRLSIEAWHPPPIHTIVPNELAEPIRQLPGRTYAPLLGQHEIGARRLARVANRHGALTAAERTQRLLELLDEGRVGIGRPAQHDAAAVLLERLVDVDDLLGREAPAVDVLIVTK